MGKMDKVGKMIKQRNYLELSVQSSFEPCSLNPLNLNASHDNNLFISDKMCTNGL